MKHFTSLLIVILLCGVINTQAQVNFIKFFSDYSTPIEKRLAVNKISAVGGGVEINFHVTNSLSISLQGGYRLYSLQQDSAVTQWNWLFYNTRYKGTVQSDTTADPNLKASLTPVQKMDVLPVSIMLKDRFTIMNNFNVTPSLGFGVLFYTRRLYLQEHWAKTFASLDYTFDYSYRNFAQNKYGNPYFYSLNVDLDYAITDYLGITAGAKYMKVFSFKNGLYDALNIRGDGNMKDFPFKNSFDINLGLTFYY